MNTIPIALFSSRREAESVQKLLAAAGVTARIQEESALQRLWFVSKKSAGVYLEVADAQFEEAEKLLAVLEAKGALAHAAHCPQCKSLRVNYPQFARNSVMTNMAAGLAAEIGLVERDYYCEQCHYTWPKEQHTSHRTHMAPYYFIEDVHPRASTLALKPAGPTSAQRHATS